MINDIIELKKKYNLLEDDFTIEKAKEWYEYAIPKGYVDLIYEKDELIGFCEWIKAKMIPSNFDNFPNKPENGNVLVIGTLIAERPYVMWRLKDRILNKNKDRIATIWHKRRDNKIVVIRRKDAC